MERVRAIVLAAGRSMRMGSNKLLLPWGETTVVGSVVRPLAEAGFDTLVVTGHDAESVKAAIAPVRTAFNPDFAGGISTSIAIGVRECLDFDGVLIALGDMPGLSSEVATILKETASKHDGAHIIRASYENTLHGHPVVFGRAYFQELLDLEGDEGAQRVVASHMDGLVLVPCPGEYEDIDTPEDLARRRV